MLLTQQHQQEVGRGQRRLGRAGRRHALRPAADRRRSRNPAGAPGLPAQRQTDPQHQQGQRSGQAGPQAQRYRRAPRPSRGRCRPVDLRSAGLRRPTQFAGLRARLRLPHRRRRRRGIRTRHRIQGSTQQHAAAFDPGVRCAFLPGVGKLHAQLGSGEGERGRDRGRCRFELRGDPRRIEAVPKVQLNHPALQRRQPRQRFLQPRSGRRIRQRKESPSRRRVRGGHLRDAGEAICAG